MPCLIRVRRHAGEDWTAGTYRVLVAAGSIGAIRRQKTETGRPLPITGKGIFFRQRAGLALLPAGKSRGFVPLPKKHIGESVDRH